MRRYHQTLLLDPQGAVIFQDDGVALVHVILEALLVVPDKHSAL